MIQPYTAGMDGLGKMKPEKRRKKKVNTPAAATVVVNVGHTYVVSRKKAIIAHPIPTRFAQNTQKCPPSLPPPPSLNPIQ